MKFVSQIRVLGLIILSLIIVVPAYAQAELNGAWEVVEVFGTNSEGDWKWDNVQPGLLLFHDGYYSFMVVTSNEPRKLFADNSNRTDEEMVAIYGPFTANAGTYEVTGNLLKRKTMVAKNPNRMAAEVVEESEYRLDGEYLVLIDRGENWTRQSKWQRLTK